MAHVTRTTLAALYPRAPAAHLDAVARDLPAVFARFGLDQGDHRWRFLLAQVGHESGGLTRTVEDLAYGASRLVAVWPKRFPTEAAAAPFAEKPEALANHVYADRMGNGPAASGDGWRYRGHGYIQLTGRDAYAAVGELVGLDLVARPALAAAPDHALTVTCGFWRWKRLNALCDGGDFEAVTRRINGGLVGIADRRAWLDKVIRLTSTPPPAADQPSADEVIAVQRALRAAGHPEVGAADGEIGPRTLAAITRFRQKRGLGSGLIDAALKRALGLD
jgi:putative chitinase